MVSTSLPSSLSSIDRETIREDVGWERLGRALIEYCGVPLAFFMAAGIFVNFFRGHGMYAAFLDPAQNYYLYFILNAWLVGLVYAYRQRFHAPVLFERKYEVGLAVLVAGTWLATQPLLLLIGYGAYIVAVMREDQLHGSFLPDFTDLADENEDDEAWGHLESVKGNMDTDTQE